jgi:4-hydroxybenzoate polyprenyltransferase
MRARERLHQYALLMRWHRPIGALLLLWPTLWAVWIAAAGRPDFLIVAIFATGVFTMRSAGCVINDFADRGYDPYVKRTRDRPLAAGKVSPAEALGLFVVMLGVSGTLLLLLNPLTVKLALIGALLAIIYPFTKRYTYFPQLFIGMAFGWGIPMAFAAQQDAVPRIAWLMYLGNVLWAMVYDTQYAMVDRDDDLRIGVKSTAILFEESDCAILGALQAMTVVTLIMVGNQAELGVPYYLSLFVVILLFVYQQFLIRDRSREGCFAAFMNNNWVGGVVFAGILLDYLVGGRGA